MNCITWLLKQDLTLTCMLESVQPTYSFPFVNVTHFMDLFFKYLLAFRDPSNTYKRASLGNVI